MTGYKDAGASRRLVCAVLAPATKLSAAAVIFSLHQRVSIIYVIYTASICRVNITLFRNKTFFVKKKIRLKHLPTLNIINLLSFIGIDTSMYCFSASIGWQ